MSRFEQVRMCVNGLFDPFLLDGYNIPLSTQGLPTLDSVKADYARLQGEAPIIGSLRSVAALLLLEQTASSPRNGLKSQAVFALRGSEFVGRTMLAVEREIASALDRVQNGGNVNKATLDKAELLFADPTGVALLRAYYPHASQAAGEHRHSTYSDPQTIIPWFKLGYRTGVRFYRDWLKGAYSALPNRIVDPEVAQLLSVTDHTSVDSSGSFL